MKTFVTILLLVIANSIILSQDLPHYMTPDEQKAWETYQHPENPDHITPPPFAARVMAEWEELDGVAITWTSYTPVLRQIVDYVQDECLVYIICSDSNTVKNYLTSGGVPLINLRFIYAPFNSVWIRDYGPWSIYKDKADSMSFVDWIYNRPRPADDNIPVYISNYMNVPIYQTTTTPNNFIATGGNFMTDGHNTGFSSKLILDENPGKTEAEIDTIMKKYMGLTGILR
jgi:agmatine deiminase